MMHLQLKPVGVTNGKAFAPDNTSGLDCDLIKKDMGEPLTSFVL